jgi:hypothetical protein
MARQTCISVLHLLLLVSGLALTGCGGNTAASARADALHYHLFCLTNGQSVTCEPGERKAHFNTFSKDAAHRPGSTFTIWSIGSDRSASRPFFVACIPDHWKAPVSKSKGDFLRDAREGAAGNRPGLTVREGCRPPALTTPGASKLVVFPDVSPLTGIWETISAAGTQAPIHHSGIVCDRSASTQGASCTNTKLLGLFDKWVTESLVRPESTLLVEMVGSRDTGPIFQLTVPHQLPLGERIAYILGSRVELSRLVFGPPQQYASTIAEAISVVVRLLRERRGSYRLSVLSDMVQITPGGYNFEKNVPPARDFLSWLKRNRLAADLQGIPLVACGLHSGQSGSRSVAYARLHEVWQKAFQALGATEITLVSTCDAA